MIFSGTAAFLVGNICLLILWSVALLRTGLRFLYIIVFTAVLSVFFSVIQFVLYYNPPFVFQTLGRDGYQIFYYAFVWTQILNVVLNILGIALLVPWLISFSLGPTRIMPDYTEQQKLNAEVEKLIEEVATLRRPWRLPSLWLSVATTIVAITVAVFQWIRSDIAYQKADLEKKKLEKQRSELQTQVTDLEQQTTSLQAEKQHLTAVATELAHILRAETSIKDLRESQYVFPILADILFPLEDSFPNPPGFPKGQGQKSTVGVSLSKDGSGVVSIVASGIGNIKQVPGFTIEIYGPDGKTVIESIPIPPQATKVATSQGPIRITGFSLTKKLQISVKPETLKSLLLPSQIGLKSLT